MSVPGAAPARVGGLTAHERSRVARDLANAVEGEVRFGLHDRMLYATDASLYQVEPLGVVIPSSIEDAVRAVRFCAERGLAILPRGGGTSLAGQCTNEAVVIDFSVRCRAVGAVDSARRLVRVEPGVTVDDLNDAIAGSGLFFAPDPATSRHANVGGCIGNNAAGARSIRYGRTSENIESIEACLADGARVAFGPGATVGDPRVREITRRVLEVVVPLGEEIERRFPRTVRRNAGYALDMIWSAVRDLARADAGRITEAMIDRVDLTPLLCGSEGTLAVTLGATLRLHERPRAKGLAVVGFASLDESIGAVPAILETSPVAVELLDDTVIDLARANAEYRRYVELMPSPASGPLRAVLYVEYFAGSAGEVARSLESLRGLMARVSPRATVHAHTEPGAMAGAWKLRKAGEPLLHGIPGARKPITFVEDNAVPVENLSRFVKEFRAIVERHGTRAAYYAHASVGVLHVRPLIDLADPRDREAMRSIAVEVADLAKSLGGVMSGEHGDGRVRGPLLERYFGAPIVGAFREVKAIFDPCNLLNPGNITDLDGTRPERARLESITQSLRIEPSPGRPAHAPDATTYFSYDDQDGFDHAVQMCNGAGVCRKKQGGTMCPSYMATLDERHSTRGRGNALRLAITGQLGAMATRDSGGHGGADGALPAPEPGGRSIWSDPGTIETLDLCLSCKACKTECPSNVDIARLKAEYTAQRYRSNAEPWRARVFGAVRRLNRLGSMAPGLANLGARLGFVRAAVGGVLGIHPKRSLPRMARSLARSWGGPVSRGGGVDRANATGAPRVVLFGDCFTMYNEPAIGLAARRVLEACGYEVVLADAGCCGRAKISMGLLARAIDEVDATLARLVPLALDARTRAVVVLEPSCLSAIKDDWLALKLTTPISDRRALASKAFLGEQFVEALWDEHPRRPAFRAGGRVLLHGHCHQKALWGIETSSRALVRACGGGVESLDSGCCGMAGSFGFERAKFDLSMKIGGLTLFPAVRACDESTIVAAPGTSCRHQILDGTGRHALHPIEVLASRLVGSGDAQPSGTGVRP